ncbi:hypothetical protein [Streptomyces antarcticus]|uniref:hypothetical protein n=1 Tax=Streptomyces antarcticus TaxID=2996458 RepID=UPI00226F9D45|nr:MULTISPECIES: hypothetical protein [unclassified Streptomyces]MCY0947537.1 hypothetical protein [Streptomyces sp. H34-AA3]MCZ4087184.1 hypothetical protein [Streptomyces sp. H34-S5]
MSTEALPPHWQELFGVPPGMRLASADGPGGAGGQGDDGDLAHSGGPWSKAAAAAGDLRISTATALGKMAAAHEGISAGTAGLAATAALDTVRTSWEKRLTAVRDECGSLRPDLLTVAREIGEVDEKNRVAFSRLAVRQEPTK